MPNLMIAPFVICQDGKSRKKEDSIESLAAFFIGT
jgi:hypothetical protein